MKTKGAVSMHAYLFLFSLMCSFMLAKPTDYGLVF